MRPVALGARSLAAVLIPPDPSAHNNGLGRLGLDNEPGAVPVQVDARWGTGRALGGRSEVDVEGAEQALFEGAASSLKARRIRHIIFEDHRGASGVRERGWMALKRQG